MSMILYRHGLVDFFKIFFLKKRCPTCGEEMRLQKDKQEYIETRKSRDDEYNVGQSYQITFYCFCNRCDRRIEISELKWKL